MTQRVRIFGGVSRSAYLVSSTVSTLSFLSWLGVILSSGRNKRRSPALSPRSRTAFFVVTSRRSTFHQVELVWTTPGTTQLALLLTKVLPYSTIKHGPGVELPILILGSTQTGCCSVPPADPMDPDIASLVRCLHGTTQPWRDTSYIDFSCIVYTHPVFRKVCTSIQLPNTQFVIGLNRTDSRERISAHDL